MQSKIKQVQRGKYSGLMIRGTTSAELDKYTTTHLDRVISLASDVESGGLFGTVMNYDGTGMTAGIAQCIALYPAEIADEDNCPLDDQGPLWKLLQQIHDSVPDCTKNLYRSLNKAGFSLKNGILIHSDTKEIATGKEIRNLFTPVDGVVPESGKDLEIASKWITLFHELFSNPKTFDIQIENAKSHIEEGLNRRPRALNKKSPKELVYDKLPEDALTKDDPLDLALACLWSNAVNAPAEAYKILAEVLESRPNFSKEIHRTAAAELILSALRNSDRPNWKKRYKRTRKAAMKIWPKKFFKGPLSIMR